jgi:hypothetical protein
MSAARVQRQRLAVVQQIEAARLAMERVRAAHRNLSWSDADFINLWRGAIGPTGCAAGDERDTASDQP